MPSNDKHEYKLYAETANLLADLYFKKQNGRGRVRMPILFDLQKQTMQDAKRG